MSITNAGTMRMTVTPANKTSVLISIRDDSTDIAYNYALEVFNSLFAGTSTANISVQPGRSYTITGTIMEGNGNTSFSVSLNLPDEILITIDMDEVPFDVPDVDLIPDEQDAADHIYIVQRGDSLYLIAKRYLNNGNRWGELWHLNRDVIGANPRLIHPGQEIRLIPH